MENIKIGKKFFIFYLRDNALKKTIRELLQKIPVSHLRGLRTIYQPLFIEDPDGRGKRSNAFYDPKKNAISLGLKIVSFPSLEDRLFHEIGHHLFRKIMPGQLKDQWIACMTELRKDENLSHELYFNLSGDEEQFAHHYGYKIANGFTYDKLPKQLKMILDMTTG